MQIIGMITNTNVVVPFGAPWRATLRLDGQYDFVEYTWKDKIYREQWVYDDDGVFIGCDTPTEVEG